MSAPYRSAASTGSGPSASRSASVPRSAYVITKYGRPSGSSPMSCTRTTRSESARRRILASSSNRVRTSSRCAQLSASTLTADRRVEHLVAGQPDGGEPATADPPHHPVAAEAVGCGHRAIMAGAGYGMIGT